jgi:hypothetical protein
MGAGNEKTRILRNTPNLQISRLRSKTCWTWQALGRNLRDKKYEYRALFPDVADWSAIPMTILTHPIHETQTDLS